MRRRLQQILGIVWSFCVSFFSYLRADIKEFIGFIAPKDNTEKESTGGQLQPPIVSEIVPSPPSDEKAKKTVHIYTPWWKTLAELVGIAAIVWYTVETHNGISNTQKNFVKDQRPYIWNSQNQLPHLKIGDKVTWNYHYTNFGKSPAIGVAFRCQIFLAAHKTPQSKDLFAPIHNPQYMSEGFIVPPGDSSGWSTCESDEIATESDTEMVKTYDAAVGLKIFYEYSDTAGNVYTSRVCMFLRRTGTGPIGVCPTENLIN
jgi:hypothetical protein